MRMRGTGLAAVAVLGTAVMLAAGQQRVRAPSELNERAPATFKARIDTTKGTMVIEVHRDWAPYGADRFYSLVKAGYYDNCRFFRVIDKFIAQFGVHGDPTVQKIWAGATILDDPVRQSNRRGSVTFARSPEPPNARSTEVFVNLADNSSFDLNFPPFGQIVSGMDVADTLYSAYAGGPQKQLARILSEGNAFLDANFPKLDSIKTATLVP